jgi:hypothetical protein
MIGQMMVNSPHGWQTIQLLTMKLQLIVLLGWWAMEGFIAWWPMEG